MFFPKKLTFLQYWVHLKITSIESTSAVQSNSKKIGSFQPAKNSIKLSTKQLQPCSLQRHTASSAPVVIQQSPHLYSRVQDLQVTSIPNTILKPQVNLGNILAQPKPWYSYWILPFVGFITVLPSLTPIRGSKDSIVLNPYSYGFKYLKPVETTLSSRPIGFPLGGSLDTRRMRGSAHSVKLDVPVSDSFPSLMSTKVLKSFPRNLRKVNPVNAYSFSKPVWSNRVVTRRMNDKTVFARILNYSLCSSSIKLSNVMSFATAKDWMKDLNHQIASHQKTPILSYKTLETSLDLLVKQLLFSKDIEFPNAFLTKAMSANSTLDTTRMQGTNALLYVLKKGGFDPTNLIESENPLREVPLTRGVAYIPQSEDQARSIHNNSFRFLASYQDAFYFSTYIRNTHFDTNKGDKIEKLAVPGSSESRSFIPVKSATLTKIDNHNKIQAFQNTFEKERTRNQSQNITPLLLRVTKEPRGNRGFKSYGNAFDFRVIKDFQNEESILRRQMQIPTKGSNTVNFRSTSNSLISNPNISVQSQSFDVKKYIHYIKSRLITSLQSIKYRQDNDVYLQPAISLNTRTPFNSDKNLLKLARYQPDFYNGGTFVTRRMRGHGSTRPQGSGLNKYSILKEDRKGSRSQEKLIRNFHLNFAKNSTNMASPVEDKKPSTSEQLNSKQLQTFLRNIERKNHSKNSMTQASQLLSKESLTLKVPKLSRLTNASFGRVSKDLLPNPQKQFSHHNRNVQPSDLLRIKHFVFLSNREKIEYKHYRTLEVILKDEKLLYETLIRQNQKQKRRKKKRKRWTRRRRKRKRKLLRPIWTTIHLAKVINQRRLANPFSSSRISRPASQKLSTTSSRSSTYEYSRSSSSSSDLFATKQFYKLSKKSLVELTNNKRYKTKVKTVLKTFEKVHAEKTKNKLNKQVLTFLTQGYCSKSAVYQGMSVANTRVYERNSLRNYLKNERSSHFAKHNSSEKHIHARLEYNRIMYERLQAFLINYGTNIDKNWQREQDSTPFASAYSKVNSLHTKIIHNAPKEEWLWLFKYITGEIPQHPINSSIDQLRSIWAMSKLQSTNQWTGWKNFYYQEFKKGLTPTYELWQDKKPDKRYNVNNLKKRQYKHIKQLQRLRFAPQLDRGTYFALQRELRKLTALGSPYQKTGDRLAPKEKIFLNRPIDKLRLTLKSLKTVSSYNRLKEAGPLHSKSDETYQKSYITETNRNYFNYQEQEKNHASISHVITSPKKSILDLYATWWDTTETTGWGWKTLQYGAPWDRKTLYIPTKLTSELSLNYSPIIKQSYSFNNQTSWVPNSNLMISLTPDFGTSHELHVILLVATILLHLCAFLGLLSLGEVRYSTKVNLIFAYKLSTIPLKVINTAVQPLFKEPVTRYVQEDSLQVSNSFKNKLRSFNLTAQKNSELTTLTTSRNINRNISLNTYKFGFYGSLKQFVKKVLRHKNTQSHLRDSSQTIGPTAPESTIRSVIPVNTSIRDANPLFKSSDFVPLRVNKIPSYLPLQDLSKLESRKRGLQNTLTERKLRKVGLKLSYSTYYATINLIESLIDNFRDTTRSVYDFFSLPENFSPNPDEVGLDVLANFIYDFEEPLIELLPDIIETQTDKYLNRYLLTLSLLGPFGLFVQQRCKWFYRMFIGLLYEADADYRKDEEELHILYTIWAEVLNKAAEDLDLEASVIASQEDQRILLLEHLLVSSLLEQAKRRSAFRKPNAGQVLFDNSLTGLIKQTEPATINHLQNHSSEPASHSEYSLRSSSSSRFELLRTLRHKNYIFKNNTQYGSKDADSPMKNFRTRMRSSLDIADDVKNSKLSKSSLFNSQFVSTWIADQYVLYKTDETDLFIEINVPKSFASLPAIKHWDTLHQPIGAATCQIYSGILTKQMAKNILLIADNTAEKTQILQALAGETEVKLILDNSSRYASISQSVAVGMRLLRDVFDAVALQTPCIFVLEDIHLIGEKRPFLISDEDLALVTNSGLGLEQHQLYEKIQKIQQHSKHRISYFKKAYRGDAADSLPTNLLCYELFSTDQPRTEWRSSNYPIPIDFHSDLNDTHQLLGKASQLIRPVSHLLLSETQVSHDNSNTKISHFVNEPTWSTKLDENPQKNNTISSLRGKVSSIADGALANISVKLDRITQLLVIMDNVRKNKGFIVFGTTNKPQILDPALRRPGRLEETIYLPSIPNILTKWEILNSQMKSSSKLPMKSGRSKVTLDLFSIYSNLQKTSTVNQSNLLFALAQCLQNKKKIHVANTPVSEKMHVVNSRRRVRTIQTSYRFASPANKPVQKQKSIFKMQFMRQLLTEPKTIRQIAYSSLATQKVQFPNTRLNKFLNEVVSTSYEQTAKSLFEIITHQTSTGTLLFKNASVKKQLAHMEDTIYLKLYSGKELFKNELSFVFAGIIANYFAAFAQTRTLRGGFAFATSRVRVANTRMRNFSYLKNERNNVTRVYERNFGNSILDTTKDHKWQTATSLIYSYIQKRAIYNKNTYIQKLFNRHSGSISGFASPPTTALLLPAKRYENYLRAERDYEQTSLSQRTLSLQNKIEFHLNQRVLKRLYRLPIKEFYKSEIIENSLTTFSSSNLVLPRNTRNFVQQNMQSKSNFYYRNIFLNRHRHYLTNQWWTGHLTEYNIENTVMSEIDFRSYFVDRTKVIGFTGDLILDFPDADQHYNLKHRRWYLQSTSWKSWYDFGGSVTTDIMNHYIVEVYAQTYRVLNTNRELLDHYVSKLLVNYQLQEIDLISDLKQFT